MSALPTPLVSAEWLAAHAPDVRLIDARAGQDARAAYERAHLPGAVYVDLETDLSDVPGDPTRGGRHPLPSIEAFAATLGRLGVTPSTDVVVYDTSGGILAAARLWWMLRAVGHARVAVLDGGLAAAEAVGLEASSEIPAVVAEAPYPARAWTGRVVTIDEVDAHRRDPAWRVVDVRAPERHAGRVEPLDPIAGHIAGAINLPCSDNLRAEDVGAKGAFRAPADLRAAFDAALTDPARTIVSCGSGVTACHTLLALEHAGLPGAALYVGSWSEWCRSGRERG